MIKIEDLTKIYKGNLVANQDISLEIAKGTIVALIGHNGAGKTTLLNQICGLAVPTQGRILVGNKEVQKETVQVKKMVSSMPQFQAPLKGVTVRQAIATVAMLKGLSTKEAQTRTKELIAYLEIEKWQDTVGEKLSGGLQRLTSFAMTVIDDSPIMILDEPTNDVDPIRRRLMWQYLRKLARKGRCILVVTHNLFEVELYADRYLLLDKGKLKKDKNLSKGDETKSHHLLYLYDVNEKESQQFSDYKVQYDKGERRLTVFLKAKDLSAILSKIESGQIGRYELKRAGLYESYEDLLG